MQVASCRCPARVEFAYFLVKYGRIGEDLQRAFRRIGLNHEMHEIEAEASHGSDRW